MTRATGGPSRAERVCGLIRPERLGAAHAAGEPALPVGTAREVWNDAH